MSAIDSPLAQIPALQESSQPNSLSERLAAGIEEAVKAGVLTSGDRLGTKGDLARHFKVAPATISELVRLLETRGRIRTRPGRGGGIFITEPSSQVRLSHLILGFRLDGTPVSDCLVVRNALEPLICDDAGRDATGDDLLDLGQIIAEMEQAVADPEKFLRVNWSLHRRIAAITKNVALQSIYLALLQFVEGELDDVSGDSAFDAEENLNVHRRLVAAIASRDPEQIAEAVARHAPEAIAVGAESTASSG